MLALPFCPP